LTSIRYLLLLAYISRRGVLEQDSLGLWDPGPAVWEDGEKSRAETNCYHLGWQNLCL